MIRKWYICGILPITNRTKKGSEFKRLKTSALQAWLEEYTLGDLWGKNHFGAQPYSV